MRHGWLTGLLCLVCSSLQAAEQLVLFTYQQKPPYVVDAEQARGLYYDLAELLNARLPQYRFVVRVVPRRRLDHGLAAGKLPGLVLGVAPEWFADAPRHLWSEVFIDDANLLLSRSSGTASRLPLDGLEGLRLGLLGGSHYPELDALLSAGRVQRKDAAYEEDNLQRLLRGWVDAIVIGQRTLDFRLQQEPQLAARLHVDNPPLRHFQRRVLVPVQHAAVLPELDRILRLLPKDAEWQAHLRRYR
ncbi:hypothetical protein HNE05_09150 [Aquipseudomonas campi]|uniref:Transporter substrate-binding domain-containing protein n=1 Tax=Aquipseudomonas campi TaxID=2731681 RepID=A0A6M8FRW0_9GAMM|nr:hypothetical protein [Pseudomonas campi]QKE63518.1 hypothetical protein HNE05_09150 [Pseudomonas campi]